MLWVAISFSRVTFDELHLRAEYMIGGVLIDLSGLLVRFRRKGGLHRMRLSLAGAVQPVGIGPRRPVRHQSIFCERAGAGGRTLSTASPRLLGGVDTYRIHKKRRSAVDDKPAS